MNVIDTNNLTKSFKGHNVVRSISLQVKKGEIFGFLGRNGAGKTTFINMLTGIMMPTSGEFNLLNYKGNLDDIKHRIGVLPDYSSFYDNLSAKNHLKYFSKVSGKKISNSKISETLQLVGLTEHQNKKVGKFSFGMKKKLGIAQAIVHDPEILFLDEPTSGVDAEAVIQIQKLIKELNRQGKTIFMTSHNLDEVEKICTNIAIMKEGKIFTQGSMEELRKAYQSTLTIRIKLSPELTMEHQERIEQNLSKETYKYEWDENYLVTEVFTEEDIPVLLMHLMSEGIGIYAVNVIEPSLEEIFLEQHVLNLKD
ncbi:ABC-2 type transport system ATP-binding protein [Peribacillus frigoritolerans]|uniref:ABC transporter ATP-binding protein n=1 Tax=Peribacillus frigoritolerans TaxID=450367 RepID=UPI000BBA403E|nr:ABC transporter ATP-binding protein [Peribacillus frigoritolerans]MCP1491935.1 ABC-2 type transport system ATP-binding protein [Peribacillus frigoritolerans]PCD04984.1 ABC transporter ATP-binding protein [Peribacillus simplex]